MKNPVNAAIPGRWSNAELLLAHRLQHYPNINPALANSLIFSVYSFSGRRD